MLVHHVRADIGSGTTPDGTSIFLRRSVRKGLQFALNRESFGVVALINTSLGSFDSVIRLLGITHARSRALEGIILQ